MEERVTKELDDRVGFDTRGHSRDKKLDGEAEVNDDDQVNKIQFSQSVGNNAQRKQWGGIKNEPVASQIAVTTRRKRLANAPPVMKSSLGRRPQTKSRSRTRAEATADGYKHNFKGLINKNNPQSNDLDVSNATISSNVTLPASKITPRQERTQLSSHQVSKETPPQPRDPPMSQQTKVILF